MEDIACPNCGGAQPKELSAGVFECTFCGQHFVNERIREQRKQDERDKASRELDKQRHENLAQQMKTSTNIEKRTMWMIGIAMVFLLALVAYMITRSMSDASEMREEMMREHQQ